MKSVVMVLLCGMLLFPVGCTKAPDTNPSTTNSPSLLTQLQPALTTLDRAAVSVLALKGIQQLAKKSPDTVNEAMTALQQSIEGDILPWLKDGAPLDTANSVGALVDSKLLAKLPADLKLAIQGTLDTAVALLNVPAGSEIINSTDLGYIVAAVQGLDDAIKSYLATPAPVK